MDDDQGALNKIEHGEFAAALNDIEVSVGKFFTRDAAPALTTFVKQFASDFGQQALALAGPAAAQVLAGTPIKDVAASLLPQITADAVTDAEKDGTVVLNALRVQVTAAVVAPAAS